MENSEASQYRQKLAEQITQQPKNERRDFLEQARETEQYKTTKDLTISERRESLETKRLIEEQREILRGGESPEIILDGAQSFTSEVIEKYPQINEDGKLNYYIIGSLSVMLLLEAGKFEILDEKEIPKINVIGSKEIPQESIQHLKSFVRKIGDFDFVETDVYGEQKKAINQSYGKLPDEEYSQKRKQLLFKGVGGPQISELSEKARKVLKIGEGQLAVMYDPLETTTPHRVVRVKLNNQEVYVPDPRMILAYKVVHLGQSFENGNKTDKFVSDFDSMLNALTKMYSYEDLLQATYEAIFSYTPNFPNMTFVPYHNSKFQGKLRKFYDELLSLYDDSKYLDQLEYGKERSFGILQILHRYQSNEAKQAVVDFINRHKEIINQWSVNSTSQNNREVIANYLLSHDDLLESFKKHIQGEITKANIVEALKTHSWAFNRYGSQVSNKDTLDMLPERSTVIDILMRINEDNLQQELEDIGDLLEHGINEFHLYEMLNSKYMSDILVRQKVFSDLKTARASLNDPIFEQFTSKLYTVIADTNYYDPSSNTFITIEEEERPDRVNAVLNEFNIYERQ